MVLQTIRGIWCQKHIFFFLILLSRLSFDTIYIFIILHLTNFIRILFLHDIFNGWLNIIITSSSIKIWINFLIVLNYIFFHLEFNYFFKFLICLHSRPTSSTLDLIIIILKALNFLLLYLFNFPLIIWPSDIFFLTIIRFGRIIKILFAFLIRCFSLLWHINC